MCRSVPQMPVRRTRIRTSPGPGVGSGTSRSQSPGAASAFTRAFKNRALAKSRLRALGSRRLARGDERAQPRRQQRHLLLEAAGRRRPGQLATGEGVVVLVWLADDIDSVDARPDERPARRDDLLAQPAQECEVVGQRTDLARDLESSGCELEEVAPRRLEAGDQIAVPGPSAVRGGEAGA